MRANVNPGAPGPADSADSAGPVDPADLADLILRVARRIQALEVRATGGASLTHLEAMVMSRIDDDPGITPTVLRAALGLRSSNMSAALKSLESKGLITRTPDPADGRVTRIAPTDLAAENLAFVREVWRQALEPTLGGVVGRTVGDVDGSAAAQDADLAADLAAASRVLRRISEQLD